jgi:hypothetical protein
MTDEILPMSTDAQINPVSGLPTDFDMEARISVKRLEAIVWESQRLQWEQPAPAMLYHYTNEAGLAGIVGKGKIWLSEIFRMMDTSELTHGVSRFCEVIIERTAKSEYEAVRRLGAQYAGNLPKSARYYAETLFPHFIACLTGSQDDLPQWLIYGGGGQGFAVGFKGKELAQKFAPFSGILRLPTVPRKLSVRYDDSVLNGYAERLAAEFGTVLVLPIKQHLNESQQKVFLEATDNYFSSAVAELSLHFKNTSFAHEKEYRLLQPGSPTDKVLVRDRKGTPVRYVEWDWRAEGKDLLTEIVIGPDADKTKARQFIAQTLAEGGFAKDSVKIVESAIPFSSK